MTTAGRDLRHPAKLRRSDGLGRQILCTAFHSCSVAAVRASGNSLSLLQSLAASAVWLSAGCHPRLPSAAAPQPGTDESLRRATRPQCDSNFPLRGKYYERFQPPDASNRTSLEIRPAVRHAVKTTAARPAISSSKPAVFPQGELTALAAFAPHLSPQ